MKPKRLKLVLTTVLVVVTFVISIAVPAGDAEAGGRGKNPRGGPRGPHDPALAADHDAIRFLLANRGKIQRQVKLLPNGVETITESNDPRTAVVIQKHVASMYARVDQQRPFHLRDVLFRALFQHAAKIDMKVRKTRRGVHVLETSADPYVARLIQEHAKVVSLFVRNGPVEVRRNHPVPPR